jgi:type IV pilus assembly protein PilE
MFRNRGFTLIEVMITVVIVAILAAIALPSYSDYVRRGKITEAISGLAGMRVKMEQFFQDNRTYVGSCSAGTVAPMPVSDNFVFTCPTRTATSYKVVATGKASGPMASFSYSIDENNTRVTETVPAGWTANPSCWSIRKDGSC